jgi:hypothetical protein
MGNALEDCLTLVLSSKLIWNRKRDDADSTGKDSAGFTLLLKHDPQVFQFVPQGRSKNVTCPFRVLARTD